MELVAVLQLDRPHFGLCVRFDGLSATKDDILILVVVDEADEQRVEDLSTAGVVGVGGAQLVLGLGDVDPDRLGRAAAPIVGGRATAASTTRGDCDGQQRGTGDDPCALSNTHQ
ncbi:hypothetical protein [Nonomuraea dietziae]|uniref:hypothetical protein n=1 Tax=Nonomuraea dietziae TaxID=65515 RepID=UPI0031DF63AE